MKVVSIETRAGVIHFRCPSDGGYLWVRGDRSADWRQCTSGVQGGKTLTANSDSIEQVARKWLRRTMHHPFDQAAYEADLALDEQMDAYDE